MNSKKMGRPPKYDDEFYKLIVHEHEQYSISQLAKYHNTSNSSIIRWLAKGRSLLYGYGKEEKDKDI